MLGGIFRGIGSLVGGLFGKSSQDKANADNIKYQREFAQKGIQWKVADSKAAGIHPLFGLGANTVSFAPSSVGSTALSDGIQNAGQHIGRAVDANSTQSQRQARFIEQMQQLQLNRGALENELLQSQIAGSTIALTRQAGQGPARPGAPKTIDGQGDAYVENLPMPRHATRPATPHQEAAPVSDVGYTTTVSGGRAPVMSHDAKDRLEEDIIGGILWNVRNRLLPSIGINQSPPDTKSNWWYNPVTQEYQRTPYKTKGRMIKRISK